MGGQWEVENGGPLVFLGIRLGSSGVTIRRV